MKKIIYSIFAVSLVLALAACTKTMGDSYGTTTVPPPEGTLVEVNFEVDYPGSTALTKAAMGEKPILESLYLAIFTKDGGYLQNWIPAEFVHVSQAGVNTKATYKVYLPINDNKVFHLIANPPTTNPSFDYEDDFFDAMVTSGTDGAYWQRVVLPNGVKAKKVNGEYVLDGDGNYTVDYDSITELKHVVLVRNFAKIVVRSANESEFKVMQYALTYYPTSGTVAPWNAKISGNKPLGFDVKYTEIKSYLPQVDQSQDPEDLHIKGKFYEDLTLKDNTGYVGYSGIMPENVVFNSSEPTAFTSAAATDDQGQPLDNGLYMYERTLPNGTDQLPTVILMQVEWQTGNSLNITAGTKQWYKVELLDNEGDYMPILRNIRYTLSLSGIKEPGKSLPHDAFTGSALGNISSSLETAMLNEISDGTSRLFVEKLDYAIFSNIGSTTLEFRFHPDESSNVTVNKTDASKNVTITVSRRAVEGYANKHAVTNNVTEADITVVTHDGYDWGVIPLSIAGVPESGSLKSVIRVQAKYGTNRAIYRDVTYTVMGRQDFTNASKAEKGNGATDTVNQPVAVTIGLPSGLGQDVFPLQVRIEAYDNNLSATDPNLPVQDGLSTFPDKKAAGKRSFYYIKTIEFDDYRKYNMDTASYYYITEHTATLYTTKTSGNSTTIRLSYNNDLESKWTFNPKNLTLSF